MDKPEEKWSLFDYDNLTKKEIIEWHTRACRSIELRRRGSHPHLKGYLSEGDYLIYKDQIEREFKNLQLMFNEQLRKRNDSRE